MIIDKQPKPAIPPISFFQPITTDPSDMMTDIEYLLGILKKLNEIIGQVNSNTQFIEEYNGKIEEIEAEIKNLRQEMTDFEEEISSDITERFIQIEAQLKAMVAANLVQAKAYTDAVAANLHEEIRQVALGQITVFDPTTGMLTDLQTALDNIYDTGREEALTATEYDTLDLTATAYDGYDLTAFNYDRYGKTLLTGE